MSRRAAPRLHAPGVGVTRWRLTVGRSLGAALGAVVLVTLPVAVVFAPPASAHNELLSSNPSDGAIVARAPATATLTFAERLDAGSVQTAFSREGRAVTLPAGPVVDGNVVRQDLPQRVAKGRWTLSYRVVSKDGHPVAGQISMRIGGEPGAARPSPLPLTGTDRVAPGRRSSSALADSGPRSQGLSNGLGLVLVIPAAIAALALIGLCFYAFRGRPKHLDTTVEGSGGWRSRDGPR